MKCASSEDPAWKSGIWASVGGWRKEATGSRPGRLGAESALRPRQLPQATGLLGPGPVVVWGRCGPTSSLCRSITLSLLPPMTKAPMTSGHSDDQGDVPIQDPQLISAAESPSSPTVTSSQVSWVRTWPSVGGLWLPSPQWLEDVSHVWQDIDVTWSRGSFCLLHSRSAGPSPQQSLPIWGERESASDVTKL